MSEILSDSVWDGERTAIVVVDVQNDFVEGGSLGVQNGKNVAEGIKFISDIQSESIVYTKDWHIDPGPHFSEEPDYIDSWPRHCVAETTGADFALPFKNIDPERIFLKGQYKASYSGAEGHNVDGVGLVQWLRENDFQTVEVVGIAFDYCVKQTAIDLANAGFTVRVPAPTGDADAWTASVHPENDPQTMDELTKAGVEVTF